MLATWLWLARVDTIVVGSPLALVTTVAITATLSVDADAAVAITIALSIDIDSTGWVDTADEDAGLVLPTEAMVAEPALDGRTVLGVEG